MKPFDKDIRTEVTATKLMLAKKGLETHETFQSLIEASPLALIALDRDMSIVLWSPAARRMFGWGELEVVGNPPPMISKDKQTEFRTLWNRVLKGEEFSGTEISCRKKDGSPIEVSLSSAPLRDKHKNIAGIMAIFEDITAWKQAVKALQESELRYRTLVERMNEGFLFVDNDDIVQFANDQFLKLLGYSREEILGKEAGELFFAESDREVLKKKSRRIRASIADRYEIKMRTESGGLIWVEISSIPVYDAAGKVIGRAGIYTDITERKRAEEDLRKSYEELRGLNLRLQSIRNEESTRITKAINAELQRTLAPLKSGLISIAKKLPKDQEALLKKTKSMEQSLVKLLERVQRILAGTPDEKK